MFLLLLELGDFLLELRWVHAVIPEILRVLMHGLELSLQILIGLQSVSHVFVVHKLVGNLEGHQELSSVCLSLEIWQAGTKPIENVVEGALLSMDHISHEIRIEVAWVAKDFKEATNALFGLLLGLFLHVDGLVDFVKLREDAVDKFEQLKGSLVIELDHGQMAHEGRLIQTIDNHLDFVGIQIGRLAEQLAPTTRIGVIWILRLYTNK